MPITSLIPFCFVYNVFQVPNYYYHGSYYYHYCAHPQHGTVQPGERLPLTITVRDQVNNSREAIWSLDGPHGDSVWPTANKYLELDNIIILTAVS
jgi:hypothetical protein